VAQPVDRRESHPVWPQYHFHLTLLSQPASHPDQQTQSLPKAVAAGHIYRLLVTADPDSDGHTTLRSVTMSTAIELYVESTHRLVQIESVSVTVQPESVSDTSHEFQIKVHPTYVGDALSLRLNYRRVGAVGELIPLSQYDLQGNAGQPDQSLPLHQIVLDRRLSERVRILHVAPVAATHYHICSYWDETTEFSADILSLGVSPARFIAQKHLPWDIINKIKAKSANNPISFIRWLKTHLRHYGQDFSLIIHDDSDESDMAWELIHLNLRPGDCPLLPPELTGQVPLGALITITRWVPGLHWYDIEHELTVSEQTTGGRAVALFDHGQAMPYAQVERTAFERFDADRYGDIQSFKTRLSGNIINTGLIYIGSHGIIVNEEVEKNFVLSLNRQEEIKVYDLAALPYFDDITARPIVIVNACHSAWLFRHQGVRYGLPIALLQQIAKDFIGTIGPVGQKRAAQIAEAIFANLHATAQGVRLAQLLRDLRADAFRNLSQLQQSKTPLTTEDWLDYLYTFMYVYYGNPFSRLQLTPSAKTDQEGNCP
jgi:hypothetical protein